VEYCCREVSKASVEARDARAARTAGEESRTVKESVVELESAEPELEMTRASAEATPRARAAASAKAATWEGVREARGTWAEKEKYGEAEAEAGAQVVVPVEDWRV